MNVDQLAYCEKCRAQLVHYAGVPGNNWHTPYWAHADNKPHTHTATPDPDTIQEVDQ